MNLADHTRIRIAKSFGAVAAVLSLTGTVMLLVLGRADYLIGTGALNFGVLGVGLGILTWLMIPAQPRNGAVWALAWASLFAAMFTFGVASTAFLVRGPFPALTYDALLEMSPAMLPRSAAIALHFRFWALVPALWLPLTLGLLLFPDGSPPSPRWRWVGWWSVGAITVSSVATAVNLNPWSTLAIRTADTTAQGLLGVVNDSAFLLASISALVSVASLVVRYRRSAGVTRSQIRWIAFGGAVFAASLIVGPMVESTSGAIEALGGVFFESLLIGAFGIAIARYRLYDIDIVISRTVTYAVLAAFITGMYALIVVGVGSLLGGGDEPNLALSIAAVALVAVAFEPLRNRVDMAALGFR